MASKAEILEFSTMIQELASVLDITHMDAIVQHCNNTGLEMEVAATMLSIPLKAIIKEEAQNLNLLKKSSRLPL